MKRWWGVAFAFFFCVCLSVAQIAAAQDGTDADNQSNAATDNSTETSATSNAGGSGSNAVTAETAPPAVSAAPEAAGDANNGLITMNFQNVEIPALARFISEITGKNFVIDENVRGRISIISPTRVTPEQAYSIFQSVLQLKGFTTVQAGPVIKIIPSRDARQSAALTQSQEPGTTQGDEFVTRMIKLRNTDATSVMNVVQPMISHDGLVAAFPQDNTLIISDLAYNVQRLLRIIGSLDVQGVQQNVAVIPLKLAFADDLAQQIEKIMTAREAAIHGAAVPRPGMGVVAPSAQGAGTSFSIVPDERTNSLIVLASPLEMREIKEMVSRLDVHSPNETYRIHVMHLRYAPAPEMVDVLNGLMNGTGGPSSLSPQTGRNSLGRGGSGGFGGSFASGFGGGLGSGLGGGFGNSSFGGNSFGGGLGSSMGGVGGSSSFGGLSGAGGIGSSIGSRQNNGTNNGGASTVVSNGGRGTDFESPVSITADPATNSLIVSAGPQDFETLHRVIDQLDIPRVQVFVQAIIVEVIVNRTKDIGVNFLTSGGLGGNVLGVGSLNFGNLQTALGNPLGLTGLGIGLASGNNCTVPTSTSSTSSGGTTTAGTLSVPCDIALMTSLQADTHSNVLSAPTLLTSDNEEATIVVGQNVPFVGSSSANSAISGTIFNSVERQNVGITLDIVPQVAAGDNVKLDMYEEVSNVVNGTQNAVNGPTTTIRSASTTVQVQNHRTAVIGGLISSETDTVRQGVPFLSDIPVLGNLFSDNSHDTTKQNLLVFLTPHVIRSRDDLQSLALDERQRYVRALGRQEINNMPASQFEKLYQPTFNAPVSPQQDLMQSRPLPPPTGSLGAAPGMNPAAPGENSTGGGANGPSSMYSR
jgi:general secretion pathway protein D